MRRIWTALASLLLAAAGAAAQPVVLQGEICDVEPVLNRDVHIYEVTLLCDVTVEVTNGSIIVLGTVHGRPANTLDSHSLTLAAYCSADLANCGNVLVQGGQGFDLSGRYGEAGQGGQNGGSGDPGHHGGNGGTLTILADGNIQISSVDAFGGPGGAGGAGSTDCSGAGIGGGGDGGRGGAGGAVILRHLAAAPPESVTAYGLINTSGGSGGAGGEGMGGSQCGPGTVAGVGGRGGAGGNAGPVVLAGRNVWVGQAFGAQPTISAFGGSGGDGGRGGSPQSEEFKLCTSTMLAGGPRGGGAGAGGDGGAGGNISINATRTPQNETDTGSLHGTLNVASRGGNGGSGATGGDGGRWWNGQTGPACAHYCGGPGSSSAGGNGGRGGGINVGAPRFDMVGGGNGFTIASFNSAGGAAGAGTEGASSGCHCVPGAQGGNAGFAGRAGGASLSGQPYYTPQPGVPTFWISLYGGAGANGGNGGGYGAPGGVGRCPGGNGRFLNATNPLVVVQSLAHPNPACGSNGAHSSPCDN